MNLSTLCNLGQIIGSFWASLFFTCKMAVIIVAASLWVVVRVNEIIHETLSIKPGTWEALANYKQFGLPRA